MALCCVETDQSGTTNIVKLPLAFVRSGYMRPSDGNMSWVGYAGWYESTSSRATNGVYYLWFGKFDVTPSNTDGRRLDGFPLRCLYLEKWKRNKSKEDSMRKL